MNRGAIRWTIAGPSKCKRRVKEVRRRTRRARGGDQFRIACIKDEILMVAKFEKVSETA
jgi:hypothetical protein